MKGFLTAMIVVFVPALVFGQKEPLRLWYDKPAAQWEETLPLGNGRLGMTPDGGVTEEKIVLNDITLWTGAPQDANNYDALFQDGILNLKKEGILIYLAVK